jgi:cell division protein FtsL
MTRLNLILFFALMFSALGLVNAQHKARKLYIELEQLSEAARLHDQEYGQLQLEQSTWAMHSRIELIAAQALQMQVPDATRIQVVSPDFKGEANAVQLPELAKPGVLKPGVLKPGTAMPKSVTPDSKTDALKAPAAKIVQTGAQF